MPKLQRFEGPDPAEVRARVLAEVGPEAAVVRAGRERQGGVLGFFEKELFVLEVALPEADAPVMAPEEPARSTGPLDALATETADVVAISPHHFAETFSDVLEEAEATLASTATSERSETDDPVDTVDTADVREPSHHTLKRRGAARLMRMSAPFFAKEPALRVSPPRTNRNTPKEPRASLHTAQRDVSIPIGALAPVAPAPAAPAPAAPASVTPPSSPPSPIAREDAPSTANGARSAFERRLADLGVTLAETRCTHSSLAQALFDAVSTMPPPPPAPACGSGTVVVVLGKGAGAMRLARLLCTRMGAPLDAVLPVSFAERSARARPALSSPLTAAQTVAARRTMGAVSVLAVDIGMRHAQFGLARTLIAGSRPDAIWAALPAATPIEELDAARSLGYGLDAIALYNLDAAAQPAILASAGVPVAYLDWREATPYMWSARLFERLSEQNVQ